MNGLFPTKKKYCGADARDRMNRDHVLMLRAQAEQGQFGKYWWRGGVTPGSERQRVLLNGEPCPACYEADLLAGVVRTPEGTFHGRVEIVAGDRH